MATVKEQESKNWGKVIKRTSLVVVLLALIGSGFWVAPILTEMVQRKDVTKPEENSVVAVNPQKEDSSSWRIEIVGASDFVEQVDLEYFVKQRIASSFFSLDVEEASSIIEEYPWVKSAQARKVWPNRLQVTLQEHQPWLNLNNENIISHEGILFSPSNIEEFTKLPLLKGRYGKIEDLLSMYHFFSEQMPDNDYRIVELEYSAISGWQMRLENKINLYLGNKELSERLERFLAVIDAIDDKRRVNIKYLDMRYQTGVAVGWKAVEKQDAQLAYQ